MQAPSHTTFQYQDLWPMKGGGDPTTLNHSSKITATAHTLVWHNPTPGVVSLWAHAALYHLPLL